MPKLLQLVLALVLFHAAMLCGAFAGDATDVEFAEFVSDEGTYAYLGAAMLLPVLTDGPEGEGQAARTLDAIASSVVVSQILKELTNEPRPDGDGHDSFPSAHSAAAFAAATMAADREPDQALYWYAGASLIAWSRVDLNRHRTREVIAGAILGIGIAKLENEMPRGLLISPFINPEGSGGGIELITKF